MAFKGTAGKSSSGDSMSKYDVEVEARLKKLEAAVAALESHSHDGGSGGGDIADQLKYVVEELEIRFPSPRRTFRPPSE